jgi:hypothetical protein
LTEKETAFKGWCLITQRICHADPYLVVSEKKAQFSSGGINLKNLKDMKVKEQ